MKLFQKRPHGLLNYKEQFKQLVSTSVLNSPALSMSLWKELRPKLKITIKQSTRFLLVIQLVHPLSDIVILQLVYDLTFGQTLQTVKLVKKIEPLHSQFMSIYQTPYYYKMFKHNDLVSMIDKQIKNKEFKMQTDSLLQQQHVVRYYKTHIVPLLEATQRVVVMNRDSRAVYDITKRYYNGHASKYILVKPDQENNNQERSTPNINTGKPTVQKPNKIKQRDDSLKPSGKKKEPSENVSLKSMQELRKYASTNDITILLLQQPKFQYPNIKWEEQDTVYLCTVENKKAGILADLYVNRKLTILNKKYYVLLNDSEQYAMQHTAPTTTNPYLMIAIQLYSRYLKTK